MSCNHYHGIRRKLWLLLILCVAMLPLISTSKPSQYTSSGSFPLSNGGLWEIVFGVGRGGRIQNEEATDKDNKIVFPTQPSKLSNSDQSKMNSASNGSPKKFSKKNLKKKENAAEISVDSTSQPERSNSLSPESEREALYEAYNQLHTLAQVI